MAKNQAQRQLTREIRERAQSLANQQKFAGQTKEHNKLMTQGIQQGIERYLREQSSKARDLDKQVKQLKKAEPEIHEVEKIVYRENKLAWYLLAASWLAFIGAYFWLK
uniref:DUF2956 domain-containing protein n=1 Tax=uncultured Thiotrichaceae bacterium TaxID=298394 RepID=A0A6S6S0V5_9GAMM|nr:MAG: Unknown protein [uncultured Thiotrichaceae bacterium]